VFFVIFTVFIVLFLVGFDVFLKLFFGSFLSVFSGFPCFPHDTIFFLEKSNVLHHSKFGTFRAVASTAFRAFADPNTCFFWMFLWFFMVYGSVWVLPMVSPYTQKW